MKRPALTALAVIALSLAGLSPGHADDILHWRRLPLAMPLIVGQERTIFVDHGVRVGEPVEVAGRLRVQSAGGAIYLRASEALPPTRLQLQDVATGALILVDVTAEPATDGQPPLEPVRIVDDTATTPPGNDPLTVPDDAGPVATPVPVVLTRHAAQNLYAPLRTVEPVRGIGRVNVRRDLALDGLLPTLPIRARALAAWRLDDAWVTAIQLTNATDRWLDLDPRALAGDFVAATFQHPDLGPAGRSTDTTVLYLVTRGHGLAESLPPAVAPIDPAINLSPTAAAGQAEGAHDEK